MYVWGEVPLTLADFLPLMEIYQARGKSSQPKKRKSQADDFSKNKPEKREKWSLLRLILLYAFRKSRFRELYLFML